MTIKDTIYMKKMYHAKLLIEDAPSELEDKPK